MTHFPRRLRFWTALLLVTYLGAAHAAPALAGLAPSRTSGLTEVRSVRDADLIAVQRALEHKVVVQKLRDYGVAPEEARLRVASLSDAELHQLASATKGLPSGGDGTSALIGILIVILLVIVILKLLNKEIVVR
ncbi:MAG TPA: PA2779 family protein [Candidatus Eisenbacteria bacterium]|nr:PA2779 family protein [Candidatus Eisenbacteria bacterium]